MNTEDLARLRDQAGAEHTMALAKLAEIDGNIEALRAQRRIIQADVEKARGAMRFAEIALAPASTPPAPKPSPALERAKAQLDELTEITAP